jgi:hypothetical protein
MKSQDEAEKTDLARHGIITGLPPPEQGEKFNSRRKRRRRHMSTIINFISGLLVIDMLLLATGCQTVDTTHAQDNGSSKHPPSDPSQDPSRLRLDEVRAEPSDESEDVNKIEEALRHEAVNPGADAAAIDYYHPQATDAWATGTWRDQSLQLNDGRVVIDTDIKHQ